MRLLEHYCSTQGEGPRTGTPTQFVRFAGCNLRCPGWPCDTEFAIDPKQWRPAAQNIDAPTLLADIEKSALRYGTQNICLTGGEPLLQPTDHLLKVAREAVNRLGCTVEMFTNGTRPIPLRLTNWCSFVMDWKLRGSGEKCTAEYERIRMKNILDMAYPPNSLGVRNSVKFVCKDAADLEEARQVYQALKLNELPINAYFGVVWGSSSISASWLVQQLLDDPPGPWKLNLQTHQMIWDPNERRR